MAQYAAKVMRVMDLFCRLSFPQRFQLSILFLINLRWRYRCKLKIFFVESAQLIVSCIIVDTCFLFHLLIESNEYGTQKVHYSKLVFDFASKTTKSEVIFAIVCPKPKQWPSNEAHGAKQWNECVYEAILINEKHVHKHRFIAVAKNNVISFPSSVLFIHRTNWFVLDGIFIVLFQRMYLLCNAAIWWHRIFFFIRSSLSFSIFHFLLTAIRFATCKRIHPEH